MLPVRVAKPLPTFSEGPPPAFATLAEWRALSIWTRMAKAACVWGRGLAAD